MSNERTVKELIVPGKKIYVFLRDDETGEKFLRTAEEEGFTFGDGTKPSERHYSRVMALHADGTLSFVGAIGMMAFGSGDESIVRVDFA